MQTKLAFYLNNIFKYVAIFCICFIWSNYYYPNFLGCVILSIFTTSLICFITSKIFYIKHEKREKTLKEQQKTEQILNQLLFLNQTELIEYFYVAFKNLNFNVNKLKNCITFNNNIIVPFFSFELTTNDFLSIYKTHNKSNKNLVILTNKVSTELNSFLSNFDLSYVKLVTRLDVYSKIIKPSNVIPNINIQPTKTIKLTWLKVCQYAFNKKNTKSYFLSGFLVMFSSLFYKYGLYYQIVGTILFILSLYSHFNTRFNQPPNTNIFK